MWPLTWSRKGASCEWNRTWNPRYFLKRFFIHRKFFSNQYVIFIICTQLHMQSYLCKMNSLFNCLIHHTYAYTVHCPFADNSSCSCQVNDNDSTTGCQRWIWGRSKFYPVIPFWYWGNPMMRSFLLCTICGQTKKCSHKNVYKSFNQLGIFQNI